MDAEMHRQLQMKAAEEAAALRLFTVAGSRKQHVMDEVMHRRDLFVEDWKRNERSGRDLTALSAALESVTRDVARGWL